MDLMKTSGNETHGLSLPAPVTEPEVGNLSVQETAQNEPETAAVPAEKFTGTALPALPLPPATPQQTAQKTSSDTQINDVSKTSKGVVSKVIEDKDLIEKEWVEKAKAIIERNREDPYKQTEEITVVKAEFMEENYNKSIKLSR